MIEAKTARGPRISRRPLTLLDRQTARRRLRKSLHNLSQAELAELLARAGMTGDELFQLATPVRHRRRLVRMLVHFGLEAEQLVQSNWAELRTADRTCARCDNVRKCRHWFDWGRRNNAPRIFCPNAALFDELAREKRTSAA